MENQLTKLANAQAALAAIRVVAGAWAQAWPILVDCWEQEGEVAPMREQAHTVYEQLEQLERSIKKLIIEKSIHLKGKA